MIQATDKQTGAVLSGGDAIRALAKHTATRIIEVERIERAVRSHNTEKAVRIPK